MMFISYQKTNVYNIVPDRDLLKINIIDNAGFSPRGYTTRIRNKRQTGIMKNVLSTRNTQHIGRHPND